MRGRTLWTVGSFYRAMLCMRGTSVRPVAAAVGARGCGCRGFRFVLVVLVWSPGCLSVGLLTVRPVAASSLSDEAVWYKSLSVASPGGGRVPHSLGGLGDHSIDVGPA